MYRDQELWEAFAQRRRPPRVAAPQRVQTALAAVLKAAGVKNQARWRRLRAAWVETAGPELAGASRLLEYRRHELVVGVFDATRRYELEQFKKPALLAALQERLSDDLFVRDLKFRSATDAPTASASARRARRAPRPRVAAVRQRPAGATE